MFSIDYAKKVFANKNYKAVISYHLSSDKSVMDLERLNLIAQCYSKLEDYYKEIEYLEKITQINSEDKKHTQIVDNLIDIAKAYKKLKKRESYEKTIDYLTKALTISKNYNVSLETQNRIHNNIANSYVRLSKKDKAFEHYNKSLDITKKSNDSIKIAITYSNMAAMYIGLNASKEDLNKSTQYIDLAIHYSTKPPIDLYINLGIIDYLLNNFQDAVRSHNKAIEYLTEIKLIESSNLPNIDAIKDLEKKDVLLKILFEKTYAWVKYAEQKSNPQFLEEGLKTIELADKIIDLLFIETKEEKTKILWRRKASKFYFLGIHISHLLNNNETSFYFAEKNKAILLLNNTDAHNINQLQDIPDNLKNREIKLKKAIYDLENKLHHNNEKNSIKNKLFNLKLELQSFSDSLTTIFPKYIPQNNKLKKVLSLKEVQNTIKDTNTCYLSYVWNKTENQFNALYGIAITKNKTHSFKIKDLASFNAKATKFKDIISKPFSNIEDKNNYLKTGYSLYNDLFPMEIRTLIKNKKLVIIPDSDLSNIPFEALVCSDKKLDYLIYSHSINYAYSISFLIENNTIERHPEKQFLSLAPHTFNYDNLTTLPRSIKEAKSIAQTLNGDTFLEEKATKDNFFSSIGNYKIIHLSTHANANDSIAPWIAFKDDKLYLNELYTTKNQADLVVLSACKSSLGEIKEGEGVFSLARGFFFSGSKSVVSSLWNVNDKSNEEITIEFYNYLKEGKTKSAALRLSKLDYLKAHSLSEISPYYWSSLVLIGDSSSIQLSDFNWLYPLSIVVLLLMFFFFLKKRKTKGNI